MTWGQLCGIVCFALGLLTNGVFFNQQAGRELQTVTSFILLELTLLTFSSASGGRRLLFSCCQSWHLFLSCKLGEYSERCVSLSSVVPVLHGTML